MPEIMLSSLLGKDLSSQPNLKLTDTSEGSQAAAAKDSEFTHMLSSVVDQTESLEGINDTKNVDESLVQLSSMLESLSEELNAIETDIPELSSLQSFLNGHDLTTQDLNEGNLGAKLPEFLNQLQTQLNDLKDVTTGEQSLVNEELTELEPVLTHITQLLNSVVMQADSKLSVSNQAELSPPLLSFAFNSGNGRGEGSQWQKYDPQQLSQNGQLSDVNLSDTDLMPEQLVSKADRSFQLQLDQMVLEKTLNADDKPSTLINSLTDVKDKPVNALSELQLKSTNETLKQYSTTLSTPVTAQSWSDEVSQKVVWFSGRNINAAEMHLNPAELGPIDVKISVQNDVASVTFNVNNSSVKDLLESSVVRLREMMEANGVNVGEVTVDSDSRGRSGQQGSDAEHTNKTASVNDATESGDDIREETLSLSETNLVDYFV